MVDLKNTLGRVAHPGFFLASTTAHTTSAADIFDQPEGRLVEDIAFRVLAADNQPNSRTISDFRKIHLKTMEGLFEQVLKIALEAGALKVGWAALDGTRIKANASKHKAMS